jgi:hypothetical protein
MLALTVAASALAGCSGGSGDPGDVTHDPPDAGPDSPPPPGDGWDGRTNVEAIFEASCARCHGTQWSTCWTVQACATSVDSAVSSGAMPRGSSLSASDKSTLLSWLGDGAPCAGTKPAGPGGCGGVIGGGAPAESAP